MILISPTEPQLLRDLGETSLIPEEYGADLLIPGQGFMVAVQRKQFPQDFLSSLYDRRLARLLIKMQRAGMRSIVLEGKPNWSGPAYGGVLMNSRSNEAEFTRANLRGIVWSLWHEFGVSVVWSDTLADTIELVRGLASWAGKERHESLLGKGSTPTSDIRGRVRERDLGVWILQSIDGIGPKLAGEIFDHFKGVPLAWTVSPEEMGKVPGVGPKRVAKLMSSLPGGKRQ
jgi:ERCC4-type nuclease